MKKFRSSVILAVCIGVAIAAHGAANAAPVIGIKGYRIEPPKGWVVKQDFGPNDVVMVDATPANLPTTISLTLEPVASKAPPAIALRNYVDTSIDGMRKDLTKFTLLGEVDTTLGGDKAVSCEGTYEATGTAVTARVHQVYVVHGASQYVLALTTNSDDIEKYEPVFKAVRESFTFGSLKGAVYTSPDGYRVTPPGEWTVYGQPEKHEVYFIEQSSRDFRANVHIVVRPGLPPAYTAERFYSERELMNRSQYPASQGFTVLSQQITTVAGVKAVDTVLQSKSMTDGAVKPQRMRDIMIPHNGSLVEIITMSLESKHVAYDPVIAAVVGSLQWVTAGPSGE